MKLGGRPRFCRKSWVGRRPWVDSRVGGSKLPGRFQCPFFNNHSVTVNYALHQQGISNLCAYPYRLW